MSKWSDAYNALPYEVRFIGKMHEAELRIQHLNFEKERLLKRYLQSMKEINDHIKNCEDTLRREDKP
jgi:hypothetical protein